MKNRKWIALYLAPALIFLSVVGFAINEWRSLVAGEDRQVNYATLLQVSGFEREVSSQIEDLITSLNQMADRMGQHPFPTKENWIRDVKNQIKKHNNLYGFVWISAAGEIVYQYSSEPEFEMAPIDPNHPVQMQKPFQKNGELVHQAIYPIVRSGEKYGYLVVQGYLTKIFERIAIPYFEQGYHVKVIMDGAVVCCGKAAQIDDDNREFIKWRMSTTIKRGNSSVAITLWPTSATVGSQRRHQTIIPLLAGSLVAILLAVTFHLIFLTWWRNEKLSKLQNELLSLSLATDQSQAAVLIVDVHGVVVYANQRFIDRTGSKIEEIKGEHFSRVEDHHTSNRFYQQLDERLSNGGEWSGEIVISDVDAIFWEHVTITPVLNRHGEPIYYLAMRYDITENKELESRLDKASYHDKLTGLYNRNYLEENSGVLIIQAHLVEKKLVVIIIDLDHFKKVNDSLGHAVGDQVLLEVAERLQRFMKTPKDLLVRLGGDEFCLVLTEISDEAETALIARNILTSIQERMFVLEHELVMTASMGISLYPDDGVVFSELMSNADTALFDTKRIGRAGYSFFKPEMNEAAAETLTLEMGLRDALARGEFELYYQPQVDSKTHKIISVEALLRWNHPELGLVGPDKFIPILEESGLIVEVGEWIIAEACRRVVMWSEKFSCQIAMGINISPKQLNQQEFLYRVEKILHGNGYRQGHHSIELEITESTIMEQMGDASLILNELNDRLGIMIAIDDFGTGYSSLNALNKLPLDTLKIDRSFIMDLGEGGGAENIVSAIINMGHSLNLRIIAEGVETREELNIISAMGNVDIQGYLFSRPLPAEQLEALINNSCYIEIE